MLFRSPLLLAFGALAAASSDPSSSTDEICHSDTGCYPREFVATDSFQLVHDDQNLPPGLHIRLDVQTGRKEAKLVDPTEADSTHGYSSSDIVIVDTVGGGEDHEAPKAAAYSPPAAHAGVSHGIKPPANAGDDAGTFHAAADVLASASPAAADLTAALASLEELAHSIYWGAELCKPATTSVLLSLIATAPQPATRASAALVLGAALSNNPAALANAGSGALVRPLLAALEAEKDAAVRKRVLFVVAQTVRDAPGRAAFLRADGVDALRGVFEADQGGEIQGRVAVVVEDAFLDPEMRGEGEKAGVEQAAEVDAAFCVPFQKALVDGLEGKSEDGAEKVLSALVKLRESGRCALEKGMAAWSNSVQGEGLQEMVKENRALLGGAAAGAGEL